MPPGPGRGQGRLYFLKTETRRVKKLNRKKRFFREQRRGYSKKKYFIADNY
jgi:hypothetical protein